MINPWVASMINGGHYLERWQRFSQCRCRAPVAFLTPVVRGRPRRRLIKHRFEPRDLHSFNLRHVKWSNMVATGRDTQNCHYRWRNVELVNTTKALQILLLLWSLLHNEHWLFFGKSFSYHNLTIESNPLSDIVCSWMFLPINVTFSPSQHIN